MANDPYKYFRVEARELCEGLGQGILRLERGDPPAELVPGLLRLAHTLKGAARVVKQPAVAELAHAMEDILSGLRAQRTPMAREQGCRLLQLLDEITASVRALDRAAGAPAPGPNAEPLDTVRIEIAELDALLDDVAEAAARIAASRRDAAAIERLRELAGSLAGAPGASPRAPALAAALREGLDRLGRDLNDHLAQLDSISGALHDRAQRLRLIPVATLFPPLERALRDAEEAVGRRAELETSGGDIRLDAAVVAALRDALLQLVRNAVAHGVEREAERVRAGKPTVGRVRVAVSRRGARVAICCEDDGAGIDVAAVRRVAAARGLVSAERAAGLDRDAVLELLLTGRLTTTGNVTEIAGRGVGLDVVREAAARCKGEVAIRSQPGRGTAVELLVPVSLASLSGLLVESAGAVAVIPIDAVRATARVREHEMARAGDADALVHEGRLVPFLPLARALGRDGAAPRRSGRRAWTAVVVQAGERLAALGVDRCAGATTVIVRSIPAAAHATAVVAGASLDPDGNPQLVLDPAALVAAADAARGAPVEAEAKPGPVLVVDDSLTTRMLEQSILESAGYEVDLAVSAEDALRKARERQYSLFLVDVEMPGMDGFEFVTRTRSDPALRAVPAILVTSRDAPEDRRRGREAGAHAYVVKSEFDQQRLLETIESLVRR